MSLICAVDPLVIVLPIVLAQYILATFALVRLARAQLSTGKYILWNIFIMLVFFIGSAVFFIWDAVRKKKAKGIAGGDNAAESGDFEQ